MPYLTRRGVPVARLRASFWRSRSRGTTCSAPRRIRASCSSTLGKPAISVGPSRVPASGGGNPLTHRSGGFHPPLAGSGKHLVPADGLECLTMVSDGRFALTVGPADDQHIKAGRLFEQAVLLEEVEGQARQALLLGVVDRLGGAVGVATRRAHLDKDDGAVVQGDQVQLAQRAGVVTTENAETGPDQEAGGGAFGPRPEPAPPPGFAWGQGHGVLAHSAGLACCDCFSACFSALAAARAAFWAATSAGLALRSRRRVALPTRPRR